MKNGCDSLPDELANKRDLHWFFVCLQGEFGLATPLAHVSALEHFERGHPVDLRCCNDALLVREHSDAVSELDFLEQFAQ